MNYPIRGHPTLDPSKSLDPSNPEVADALAALAALHRFLFLSSAPQNAPPPAEAAPTEAEINRLVSVRFVAAMLDCTPKTVRNMEAAGTFPRAIRLTSNKVAWRLSTVISWVQTRDREAQKSD
jgi:predicted DNA-binding transcriptional regulator AlpA